LAAIGPAVALGGFVAGAFLGGRLAHRLGRPRRRWLAIAFGGHLVCVAGATAVATAIAPVETGPVQLALIAVLGVGMGVQTATARALAVPDLNTAVITITLTGLVADLHLGRETVPRPGRRMLAIVALLLGALVGALVIVHAGLAAALALTLAVLLAASVGLVWVAEDDDRSPEDPG
jgi:MFS family permease